jgi:hypothetical protein
LSGLHRQIAGRAGRFFGTEKLQAEGRLCRPSAFNQGYAVALVENEKAPGGAFSFVLFQSEKSAGFAGDFSALQSRSKVGFHF